jgi:hypothetical protein
VLRDDAVSPGADVDERQVDHGTVRFDVTGVGGERAEETAQEAALGDDVMADAAIVR